MDNRQLAELISERIGERPVPFESVWGIALDIYHELGGAENDFDSVYSILLEIMPLAQEVVNRTPITEVDELPDAVENKNKFYRLSSDKKVYMSTQIAEDTYTDRLPDNQQVNKAYLWESESDFYYYKGAWKIILNNGEVNGYGWLETFNDSNEWYLYVSQYDAVNATGTTKCFNVNFDEVDDVDFGNHTVTIDDVLANYAWEQGDSFDDWGVYVIFATYNVSETDCIGNAALVDSANNETGVYTGEQIIFYDDIGTQMTGYRWENVNDSTYCFATSKPASEIYAHKPPVGQYHYLTDTILYTIDLSGNYLDEITPFVGLKIPQLNAPDSEQVGKAYWRRRAGFPKLTYKGEFTIQCDDGNITVYKWSLSSDESIIEDVLITKIPASDIYKVSTTNINNTVADMVYLTDLSYRQVYPYVYDGTIEDFNDEFVLQTNTFNVQNLVKYQRKIEHWGWKQLPTIDDVQGIIDDSELSDTKTWSSHNIFEELGNTYRSLYSQLAVTRVHIDNEQTSTELQPNKIYIFDNRTSGLTLTLGSITYSDLLNEYHFFIYCGSTPPTVTWPTEISTADKWYNGSLPTMKANTIFEISVMDNIAVYAEISNPT